MIQFDVTARHLEIDDKMRAYVDEKLSRLDRTAHKSLHIKRGKAILEHDKSGREGNQFVCDVTLSVAGTDLHAREATMNIYAAIDICEAKLRAQIGRHKEKVRGRQRGGLFAKLWGRRAVDQASQVEPTDS